jgi:hypothetical protein
VVRASFEAIKKYVRQLNFLGPVNRAIDRRFLQRRIVEPSKKKKIDADVDEVFEFLKKTTGSTWVVASQPRTKAASLLVNPARSPQPWLAVEKIGQSLLSRVRSLASGSHQHKNHLDVIFVVNATTWSILVAAPSRFS